MPSGRKPSAGRPCVCASGKRPFTISNAVPSPPTARKLRKPCAYARAQAPWLRPAAWSARLRARCPLRRTRSSAAGASLPQRPPPAAGFTMAKKFAILSARRRDDHSGTTASRPQPVANLFGQLAALDFQRSGARKIALPDQIAADALVIQQAAGCARQDSRSASAVDRVSRLGMKRPARVFRPPSCARARDNSRRKRKIPSPAALRKTFSMSSG